LCFLRKPLLAHDLCSSDGGIGTILIDDNEKDSVGTAPGDLFSRECCGGSEDSAGRERGCWDELMEDGELFDNEDPWLADDLKNG
jgi:hypothetical protein